MDIPTSSSSVKSSCKSLVFGLFPSLSLSDSFSDKRTGTLCLIFELMNMNLYEYIRGRQRMLSTEVICKFMYQLLKALEYIHR